MALLGTDHNCLGQVYQTHLVFLTGSRSRGSLQAGAIPGHKKNFHNSAAPAPDQSTWQRELQLLTGACSDSNSSSNLELVVVALTTSACPMPELEGDWGCVSPCLPSCCWLSFCGRPLPHTRQISSMGPIWPYVWHFCCRSFVAGWEAACVQGVCPIWPIQ